MSASGAGCLPRRSRSRLSPRDRPAALAAQAAAQPRPAAQGPGHHDVRARGASPGSSRFKLAEQASRARPARPTHPALRCNADDVCLLTTGMGHANAAASTLAVALDPRFDLRQTWFLIAGIAGIDPARGTLGTAAWARWLVDVGIAHEIDAREMPKGWKHRLLRHPDQGAGREAQARIPHRGRARSTRRCCRRRSPSAADATLARQRQGARLPRALPRPRRPTSRRASPSATRWAATPGGTATGSASTRATGPSCSPTARASTARRSRKTTRPTTRSRAPRRPAGST